jgi:CRP/FNR family transcriptional regulator
MFMLTPFEGRALRALTGNPLFQALGPARMRWVRRVALRRGEMLAEKDGPSEYLYGLVSGQLKVYSPGDRGRRVSLDILAPGELFGQIGMMDGGPYHASALALRPSELAALHRDDLMPLVEASPRLHDALGAEASRAARRLTRRLEEAAFLDTEARVERALVDLAERFGEHIERGIRIRLRQQDLAEVLGLSRECVSRVLASTARRGKLELSRGCIVLLGL